MSSDARLPLYMRILDSRVLVPSTMATALALVPFCIVTALTFSWLLEDSLQVVIVALLSAGLFTAVIFGACAHLMLKEVAKKKN